MTAFDCLKPAKFGGSVSIKAFIADIETLLPYLTTSEIQRVLEQVESYAMQRMAAGGGYTGDVRNG